MPLKIKIINHLTKIILKSKFKNHYDFSYKTQIYNIKFVLYEAHKWKNLGFIWNNIYKHYIKLNQLNIFTNTYTDLLKKYLKKYKNKNL